MMQSHRKTGYDEAMRQEVSQSDAAINRDLSKYTLRPVLIASRESITSKNTTTINYWQEFLTGYLWLISVIRALIFPENPFAMYGRF